MSNTLRFIGITKDATTAGPGKRLELFTKGCIRGVVSPCDGCFNSDTWTFEGNYREMTVDEVVDMIDRDAWNRQVTFCGGEPILQGRLFTQVAKKLKERDPSFHFVMYCSYLVESLLKHGLAFNWSKDKHGEGMQQHLSSYSHSYKVKDSDWDESTQTPDFQKIRYTILTPEDVKELMTYIDIIVDGTYQHDKRMTTHETMHDGGFIGSWNQRVYNGPKTIQTGQLKYMQADVYNTLQHKLRSCSTCGHSTLSHKQYCSSLCRTRYAKRHEEMKLMGGV